MSAAMMLRRASARCVLCVGPWLVSGLAAQRVFWADQGTFERLLNYEVMQGSDYDGDGFLDLWNVGYRNRPTDVGWDFNLLSGRDGTALLKHHFHPLTIGYAIPSRYGPAGDLDGDGYPDWWWLMSSINTSYPQPPLQIRSGRTGAMLFGLSNAGHGQRFGFASLGGVDVDGEGIPEFIVSEIDSSGPGTGSIFVFRRDQSLVYRIDSPPRWQWGTALAKVGDVDGDGGEDFVFAAPEDSLRGSAVLVSGRTGRILQVGYGELAGDRMDFAVAGCGDMDRDGVPDFAGGGFWGARGVARVFSGRTGAVLHSWVGLYDGAFVGAYFGHVLIGGMDVDQDGVPDLVTHTLAELRPGVWLGDTLYAMSGRDGRIILEHYDRNLSLESFFSMASVSASDVPAVGLWVKRYDNQNQQYGRHEMIDLRPRGVTYLGRGCNLAGGAPVRLGLSRDRDRYTRILASDLAPGSTCVLLLGRSNTSWNGRPLPLDLGAYGWPGCALFTSIDVMVPVAAGTQRPYDGLAVVDLPWPLAATSNLPLHLQWLCFEGRNARMSKAARILLDLR